MTTQTSNGMDAFFTADKAEEGVRIPLVLPTGEATEHWLLIYGVDSEEFQLADAEVRSREVPKLNEIKDKRERERARLALRRKLRARLVKDWSFPEPCTTKAVEQLFAKAPQIADAVDTIATDRALFFALASTSSSDTAGTSSGSTASPTINANPDEPASSTSATAEETSPS